MVAISKSNDHLTYAFNHIKYNVCILKNKICDDSLAQYLSEFSLPHHYLISLIPFACANRWAATSIKAPQIVNSKSNVDKQKNAITFSRTKIIEEIFWQAILSIHFKWSLPPIVKLSFAVSRKILVIYLQRVCSHIYIIPYVNKCNIQ